MSAATPPGPGRPRSFEESDALDRVMRIFWAKGFPDTSYPDLEQATGLHRQSLRYAFGDKAGLYRRAVEHYAQGKVDAVFAVLRRPGPALAGIEAVFELWGRDARAAGRGCLMVNGLAETAEARMAVRAVLAAANRRLVEAFTAAFRAAQDEGTIRDGLDPASLAIQAVALGDGLLLHARGQDGLTAEPERVLRDFLALARKG